MFNRTVLGSGLAASAAGVFSFWKVCLAVDDGTSQSVEKAKRSFVQETQVASSDKQPDEPKPKQPDKAPRGVVLVLDLEGVSLVEKCGLAQGVRYITKRSLSRSLIHGRHYVLLLQLKSSPLVPGQSHSLRLAEVSLNCPSPR